MRTGAVRCESCVYTLESNQACITDPGLDPLTQIVELAIVTAPSRGFGEAAV